MAQYSAEIAIKASVEQALKGVQKIERALEKLQDTTIKIKAIGTEDIQQAERSFKVLQGTLKNTAKAVLFVGKNFAALGAAAAATQVLAFANNIKGLQTPISQAAASLSGLTNNIIDLASAQPLLTAQIAASAVALAAFGPQIATVTGRLIKFAASAAAAKAPLQSLLNTYSELTGAFDDSFASFDQQFKTEIIEAYRRKLFEISETVSELSRRKKDLQTNLDRFNSSSDTAVKIANKLVDVQARLNDELREQRDLLREAAGINVTELEASKGRNSIETRQKRESFQSTQASEQDEMLAALQAQEQRVLSPLQQQLGLNQNIEEAQRTLNAEIKKALGTPDLVGQSSEVGGRVARLKAVQDDSIKLEQALFALSKKTAEEKFKQVDAQEALVRGANEVKALAAEARGETISSSITGKKSTPRAEELAEKRFEKQNRTRRAEDIAKEAALKSKANQEEFAALKNYQDELFNIERSFIRKLRSEKIDAVLAAAEIEGKKQDELFQRIKRNNKEGVDDFDRRLKASADKREARSQALTLTGQSSPVGGAENILGSPAAKKATAQAKKRKDMQSNAVIGGAFPLLFGQGIGASAGGAAGGALGGALGGQFGFGLSLVGTALGTAFDTLVAKAASIGNLIGVAASNMDALRDSGISVTAELDAQVRALNRYNDAEGAQRRINETLFTQTGDIDGQAVKLAAGSTNELQKAWQGVSAAAAAAFSIIAAPFIQAVTALLRGVQAILFVFNAIVTTVTAIVGLIPGLRELGDFLFQQSIKGTAEYEKRRSALVKESEALFRTLKEQEKYNSALEKSNKFRSNDLKVAKELIDLEAQKRASVETVLNKQEELGGGRTPEETARIEQQIGLVRSIEIEKQRKTRLQIENSILTAQEANVKKINDLNASTAKTYRDMRISFERQVEDAQIKSVRAVQDIQLKGARALLSFREQELRLVQSGRSAQLDRSAALGQLQTGLDPTSGEGLAAEVTLAVERYKNGIKEADENKKLTEEKIQLDTFESQLKLERFKQDSARNIARLNEDSTRKIADINDRLAKQREESFKVGYDFTLKRLIAEKKSEEGGLLSQIAGQEALISGPFANLFPELQKQAKAAIAQITAEVTEVRNSIRDLQQLQGKIPATPQVQGLGSLPSLTDTSGRTSEAESELIRVIEAGKARIAQLQEQNLLEESSNKLIQDSLNIINPTLTAQNKIKASLEAQFAKKVAMNALIRDGINPAIAEELVNIDAVSKSLTGAVDTLLVELNKLAKNPALQDLIDALLKIKDGQPALVAKQKGLVGDTAAEDAAAKKREEDAATLDALYKGIGNTIQTGIVDAIATGVEGLINGTKDLGESLQEIASGVLADIGKQLLSFGVKTGLQALTGGTGFEALFRADGGPVSANTPYIVGERGPELMIPSTSGMVLSNSETRQQLTQQDSAMRSTEATRQQLTQQDSAMRSTEATRQQLNTQRNTMVTNSTRETERMTEMMLSNPDPIDVRYESTVINSVEYVTAEQHRQGMTQAAERGRAMTLTTLQNSPRTRSKVGI